jgi:TPR repeat protein
MHLIPSLLRLLAAALVMLGFAATPAQADIPALCAPAKARHDKAMASGDRGAVIAARERIKVLANACPQLLAAVSRQSLPSATKAATAKASQPVPKKAVTVPTVSAPTTAVALGEKAEALFARNDYVSARPASEKACASGWSNSCFQLAWMLDSGEGGPKNQLRARSLYQTACDGGAGLACLNSGIMFETGWPDGVKNEALARSVYQKACDSGFWLGCSNFAGMLEEGRGGPIDRPRAKGLFALACARGDTEACKRK